MIYFEQLLWLASWPALIVASYYSIKYVLKKFETRLQK